MITIGKQTGWIHAFTFIASIALLLVFNTQRISTAASPLAETSNNESPLSELQARRCIIDVHEHIQSAELAPIYLNCMDRLGITKICLMGSSKFTLTLKENDGFTAYDQNDEALLKAVQQHSGRFEAWVTLNPRDEQKLSNLRRYIDHGATGLKLYVGHGHVNRTGEYLFHTVPIDDPTLLPVYSYCQENSIPICLHVNMNKQDFAGEFAAVLTRFPKLKVNCPHFMLSSTNLLRLRSFLRTFPNVYTDTSFGDYYVKDGLLRISRNADQFRKLFADYGDRILFGADLVLTRVKKKDEQWVTQQWTSYLDMLSKDKYNSALVPGQELRGLALSADQLEKVLCKNYANFTSKPVAAESQRR